MGNATKVALVALLILLVVVVARFVREDSAPDPDVAVQRPTGSTLNNLPGKVPAGPARASDTRTAVPTILPAGSTILPAGSTILPAASTGRAPAVSTTTPTGTAPAVATATPAGSRVLPASQPEPVAPQPVTAPANSTALPGAASGSPPGLASTSQPSTGTPPAGGNRIDLPPPNPIGSLTAPASPGARPEDASSARLRETAPSQPVVVTQLPSSRPTGGTSSPFRDLAESGREGRSPPASEGRLSTGVAREPSAVEKTSAARLTDDPPDAGALKTGYPKTHVVAKGDSFWGLADRYYGSGSLLHVIEKANPGIKLRPGVKVTIPQPPADARPTVTTAAATSTNVSSTPREPRVPEKPAASSGNRDYVVQKGDTLGLIAKKFYGDASKLHLIEQANPDLRYQMLQAGAKIKVPATGEP